LSQYKLRKTCRLCLSKDFRLVIDLGIQPPSNSFLSKNQLKIPEKKFPLRLYLCNKCHHLQLLDVVDKKELFANYLYMTSANKPIISHFENYVADIYEKKLRGKNSKTVIEIGSNDGTLLKHFLKYDVKVLGIEPAKNLAKISAKAKIETINDFFDYKLAKKISKKVKADVIIANNILGHVDNLTSFIKGIKTLLNDEGIFVFEVPHAMNLLKNLEFDTIYHEHISYFSVIPLIRWFKNHELEIVNIEKQKVHGGTIRVYVSRKNKHKIMKSVSRIIIQEKKFGINKKTTYSDFAKKISKLKFDLVKKIISLKENGEMIFGYGAPAKGNVLLNYCDIDSRFIDFITDTTPLKQNKFTPGTHIPIKSPLIIRKKSNSIALLLAWNYKDEIVNREKQFLKSGGKFLVPIPKPIIIKKE
tara:strand:- start:176 stop:1423 length:1248 start_codon:yes stop_codon:yes gene_type:complete